MAGLPGFKIGMIFAVFQQVGKYESLKHALYM